MNINMTLLGQMIAFAIFIWFCMKYVWPPLINAMQERQKKIAEGLQEADRAAKDLELAQKKATDLLREAKEQAAQLIDQANKRGNQLIEEAKDQARAEGDRLKTAAQADIEQEVQRAKETLRAGIILDEAVTIKNQQIVFMAIKLCKLLNLFKRILIS